VLEVHHSPVPPEKAFRRLAMGSGVIVSYMIGGTYTTRSSRLLEFQLWRDRARGGVAGGSAPASGGVGATRFWNLPHRLGPVVGCKSLRGRSAGKLQSPKSAKASRTTRPNSTNDNERTRKA
jgi:hypothetical protein